ncbi:MAG: hypothetical protein GYA21_09430 [Myxococcales bacterium]|nr:hypothetical protein [Myxococcales bacterium]
MAPRRGSERRPALPWLLLLLCVGASGRASEVDLAVQTVGQGYDVLAADGELLLRRRLSHWIVLDASRLFESERLSFSLDFRLDADLEDSVGAHGGRQALLTRAELRVEAVPERLRFRVGRLWEFSELGFFRFDGVHIEGRPLFRLPLELYMGFAVRDRSILGDMELALPGSEDETLCPVVGARLSWTTAHHRVEVDYRRLAAWQDGWPLQEERLAAAGALRLFEGKLGLDAGAAYNLLLDGFDRLRADAFVGFPVASARWRLELGALYLRPFFSQDSIFNFFSPEPFAEAHGGTSLSWADGKTARLRLRQRWYLNVTPSAYPPTTTGIEAEGGLPTGRSGMLSAYVTYEDGAAGRRYLVMATWRVSPGESWLIEGRALLSSFSDPVQPHQSALGGGGGLGTTWIFGPGRALHLLLEANGNRLLPFASRLLLVLDLVFHFQGGPRA